MREERVRLSGMYILKTMNKLTKTIIILALSTVLFGCGTRIEDDTEAEIDDSTALTEASAEEVQHTDTVEEASTEEMSQESDAAEELQLSGKDFKLPDWSKYEAQMNEDEKKDFEEYLVVLNGKEKFFCFNWGGDKERSFSDYLASIESEPEPDIEELVLVDLDNQNGKELILEIYEGGGNYLILTRDKGKIYGTSVGCRWLENLQKDGKFSGAGGAFDAYYCTMKIDSNGAELNRFGELHDEEKEDGENGARLEVNGEEIEDYEKWIQDNYSDPVDWIQ